MLRRYWFRFRLAADAAPAPGVRLGCGVTAYNYEDALHLLLQVVFTNDVLPPIQEVIEDVDVSTLDANHVLPNMGVPIWRGVWFPQNSS
jgi:hypothetical protein